MNNRDDFAKSTVDTLAKRVGYFCSNPKCKKPTSGPNANEQKHTSIGVAAHISAAAPGGPRYDEDISADDRKHINNGIWLCNNCATLIDKDEKSYPREQLKVWKYQAELDMKNAISSQPSALLNSANAPILEADLLERGSSRFTKGFGGTHVYELNWRFLFVIYNNSNFPAYNLQIKLEGNTDGFRIGSLNRVNNLPAHASVDLEAQSTMDFQGDYFEADNLTTQPVPNHIRDLRIIISYKDDARFEHKMAVTFTDGNIVNQAIS